MTLQELTISLKGSTEIKIKEQSQLAIDDADVIFFVIDGREGVLPIEKSFAMSLKKQTNNCFNKQK